jgi:non-ribosomal peptide synthetase component F
MFMTLLAAFQTLLGRISGQDDLIVGTDVANRNRLETEGLIGFFVNHLALRTRLGDNPGFRQLLHRVRETTLGAYAHQDLPFDQLVRDLRIERMPGRTPLFQVLFVFGNPGMPALELPGLRIRPLASETVLSKYDLTLFMNARGAEIGGAWRYGVELFDAATIARLSDQFISLLGDIAADPDARLKSFAMLSETERNRLQPEAGEKSIPISPMRRGERKAVEL